MKGNEAMALAAINAGCEAFFGYPITPQNELIEYIAKHFVKAGKVFVQAESEVAAVNMVYGASASGKLAMTSSSSPGIALKQEGITYLSGARLPAVIVSVSRGGPGLGGILPSQADYNQVTRGGGNGDYHVVSFAPQSVQEAYDMVMKAFFIANKYRVVCMVLADGVIGQMMEPVEIKPYPYQNVGEDYGADGNSGTRPRRIINSLYLDASELEKHNHRLKAVYDQIEQNESLCTSYKMEDADVAIVSYGTPSRIAKNAVELLRNKGIKAGVVIPLTLWPFPNQQIKDLTNNVKFILNADLSMGQMVNDIRLAVECKVPVYHYGRVGGMIFEPEEIVDAVVNQWEQR